ncbi:uncharacterized protein LOC115988397 [Quercus lobata]|uniref:uncharacterized protein LOC115988397 n=1 Tax=Quercus lobata TaxID=97700 RepID=UPI0012479E60|nr:uncharacterized protein LOC115988397 [Quercus lobata]
MNPFLFTRRWGEKKNTRKTQHWGEKKNTTLGRKRSYGFRQPINFKVQVDVAWRTRVELVWPCEATEKWQKVSYGQQQRIWQGIEDEFSLFIARYCGASTPQSFHSLLQQDWLRKQRFVLSSCWLLKRHPCITLKTLLTLLSILFPF